MTDLVSTVSALAAALTADERALLLRALAPPRPRVAIVGLGCRFPGGAGPDDFWRLLARGGDAVREVPADRWDSAAYFAPDPDAPGRMLTRYGAFLDRVDQFDCRVVDVDDPDIGLDSHFGAVDGAVERARRHQPGDGHTDTDGHTDSHRRALADADPGARADGHHCRPDCHCALSDRTGTGNPVAGDRCSDA